MKKRLNPRFIRTYRLIRDGHVVFEERVANLVPLEGRNYIAGLFGSGTRIPTWYAGIYVGNYVPQDTDVAATIAAVAGETLAYTLSTRPAWVPGAVVGGVIDNFASPAEFTMNNGSPLIIYGDFLIASSTKGGTTGPLLSIARYTTPQTVLSGNKWQVIADLELFST